MLEIARQPFVGVAEAVAAVGAGDDVLILHGMRVDDSYEPLVSLCRALGRPRPGLGRSTSTDGGHPVVHRVEVLPKPALTTDGYKILSTSCDAFACHTDEYFDERPCDLVLLLCVRAAARGGDTWLSHVEDVVHCLDDDVLAALRRPIWPTPFGTIAILRDSGGKPAVQYNRYEIDSLSRARGTMLAAEDAAVLDRLDRAIVQARRTVRTIAGDCMIIDNDTVLHGRSAFDRRSRRLLLRARVYLPAPLAARREARWGPQVERLRPKA